MAAVVSFYQTHPYRLTNGVKSNIINLLNFGVGYCGFSDTASPYAIYRKEAFAVRKLRETTK